MNIDLVIKLVKLANNNPNDNEANLAARKVCRLIAEGNYEFTKAKPKDPTVRPVKTWDDVTRSAESFWKTNPWTNEANYRPSPKQEEFYRDAEYWKIPDPPKKPRQEQRMRTCVECGVEVLTHRVTNIFKCDTCEWRETL